jgi:molybdenum transport protein
VRAVPFRLRDTEIDRFLEEDCPYGDLTTTLLGIGSAAGRIVFTTRHETVLSCTEEAARMFEKQGCGTTACEPSGSLVAAGVPFLQAAGEAAGLHAAWKAALNLLEAACGIATRTRRLVEAAQAVNPAVEVVATRKIFPGTKAVATKAVYAGGAYPHRLGLSETILVFAQHVAFLGGKDELWAVVPAMKRTALEKKIAIEVTTEGDALAAARAGADMIQVDKLPPDEIATLVAGVRAAAPGVVIAAAGGINLDNVQAYAATGVDLLVTSSMYWGKPADIGVVMEPAGPGGPGTEKA